MKTLLSKSGYWRHPNLRVRTDVIENQGKTVVKKTALGNKSAKFLKKTQKNYRFLKQCFKESPEFEVVRPVKQLKDSVFFEFCPGQMLEKAIEENLIEHRFDQATQLYFKGLELIDCLPSKLTSLRKEKKFVEFFKVNKKYFDIKLEFLNQPFSEITADHIFVYKNRFWLIDYEVFFDFPIPKDFVKFRYQFYLFNNFQQILTSLSSPKLPVRLYLKNLYAPVGWLLDNDLPKNKKELFLHLEEKVQAFLNWEAPAFGRWLNYKNAKESRRLRGKFSKERVENLLYLESTSNVQGGVKEKISNRDREIERLQKDLDKITSAKFYRLWQFYCQKRDKVISLIANPKTLLSSLTRMQ